MTVEEIVQRYIDRYEPLVVEFQKNENATQQEFEDLLELLGNRAALPIWHNDTDGFVADIDDGELIREASPLAQGELTDMIIDLAASWSRKQAVANAAPPASLEQHDTDVLAHRFDRRIARLEKRGRQNTKYYAMRTVRSALLGEIDPTVGLSAIRNWNGNIWDDAKAVLRSMV